MSAPDRVWADHLVVHGRRVQLGQELTVEGLRGRCRFVGYVRTADGVEWVDVLTRSGRSRTVRPERIRTVHRRVA